MVDGQHVAMQGMFAYQEQAPPKSEKNGARRHATLLVLLHQYRRIDLSILTGQFPAHPHVPRSTHETSSRLIQRDQN